MAKPTITPTDQGPVAGFAGRLREAREAAGLTLWGLGDAAGISGPAVSQFEHGPKLPTLETAARLAAALGVRAGWLAFGEPPRKVR